MTTARLLCTLGLGLGTVMVRGQTPPQTQGDPSASAHTSNLVVLSVDQSPQLPDGTERIRVVAPWPRGPVPAGLRAQLAQSDPGRTAVPLPGADYRLLHSYVPDPRNPYVSHYVFMNLSDPNAVQNWRRWQRAQRDEDWLAREQWRQRTGFERRRIQLIRANQAAVEEGLQLMRAGDYRGASIAFSRAAEMDHGDPACRLRLAQARLALGHDREATEALRRALELQPKLVPMRLGLEQYYPSPVEFAQHVDALAQRLARRAAPGEAQFVLGFMEFQRGRYDEAYAAFQKAARMRPQDDAIQAYLVLTKPAVH
jgi:tetratricopeptide (TPR) repeat protein